MDILKNQIQIIYEIKPLFGDKNIFKDILDKSCLIRKTHTKILESHTIVECDDLKKFSN